MGFSLAYFRAEDTLEKVALRLLPNEVTAAIIATEIPAAISPYSIAVAPWSSTINFRSNLVTTGPFPAEFAPRAEVMPECAHITRVPEANDTNEWNFYMRH